MDKLLPILSVTFLLNACASSTTQQLDCTGLMKTHAQRYKKDTHRFMKNDEKLVRAYGLETVNQPETLFITACSTLAHNQPQFKLVKLHSAGYYGDYSYLHCIHRSDEPSYQIYQIFINWANQPLSIREQTISQTNEKIRALNCPASGAKNDEAAWYVENEQHDHTPVLVSNARENILLNGIFANRTFAIDLETAQLISQRIQKYLKE